MDVFWIKRLSDKTVFHFKSLSFEKLQNLVFGKISITQKEFKMFVTWFDFYSNKFVFQREYKNLFLWIFRDFMGFIW